MDDIYSATISLTESRVGGTIVIMLACRDCNGTRCKAEVELRVPAEIEHGTPFEWLQASLGALSDTLNNLPWTFHHDAECEGAAL